MSKFFLFNQFFKGYGHIYLLGVCMLIAIDILFLWVPKLTGDAINTLYYGKEGLTHYIWLFVLVAVVVTVLKFSSRHLLLGSIRRFEFLLRRRLFDHALYIPTAYYEKNGPGKVMALMTNDVTTLRVSLGLGVMIFVDAIFFGIFSFFLMAKQVSAQLAMTILTPMPFIVVAMLVLSRRMRRKQREAQNTYSDLTEFAQELFLGMPVIRAFNRELTSLHRFIGTNRTNYEKNMKVALLDALLAPVTYVAPFICYAIAIYVCGNLIITNEITVGDFVAINGYLILIIGPIMGIGSLASVLQKGFASLDRLSDFLALPEEVPGDETDELAPAPLQVRHLTFTYPETTAPVLQDVTVDIEEGAFIGIVGGPGSGKSTLFKLLLRLYDTPQGTLYIGNEDITTIPLSVLRRSIAYVPAETFLLGTSIADNITFGEEASRHITLEEAANRSALRRDLWNRIHDNAALREGGADLSGGQKQRINIARGLYKNAPYLLLDDSFSALDTVSAAGIIKTLRNGRRQTLLFISQRLEALREADRILVFKEGRIVEAGTHEELLSRNGEYCRLYAQQLQGATQGNSEGASGETEVNP